MTTEHKLTLKDQLLPSHFAQTFAAAIATGKALGI